MNHLETYLFLFGYETPTQRVNNVEHGWDDEDSQMVLIESENEEDAKEWGAAIAEEFYRQLHYPTQVSWTDDEFASMIVQKGTREWRTGNNATTPRVKVGVMPDIESMVSKALR